MTPNAEDLFEALDATWPALRMWQSGLWTLREGAGGGQRVSAATVYGTATESVIADAEEEMRAIGQRPLFMIRGGDDALDMLLAERSYEIVDPVAAYVVETAMIAKDHGPARVLTSWPPLAVSLDIWARGGIGPARISVMERAQGPKTAILAGKGDRPASVAFVSCYKDIAMLHALETTVEARRQGMGRTVMQSAATWALANGARYLSVMVTRANAPANALYRALGMAEVAQYHYRRSHSPEP